MKLFKILFSNKCGQWFRHRFHYVKGYGVRCQYCDRTKLSTVGEKRVKKVEGGICRWKSN